MRSNVEIMRLKVRSISEKVEMRQKVKIMR